MAPNPMNVENTNVQMKKGILEYCVLHIISRGEVYTSDLMTELAQARLVVVEGTLYPLLTRLKNAGWLEYKWVESAFGPPRKYYSLTALGRDMLAQMDQTWQETKQAVSMIVEKGATPPPLPTEAPLAENQAPETSSDADAKPSTAGTEEHTPAAAEPLSPADDLAQDTSASPKPNEQ